MEQLAYPLDDQRRPRARRPESLESASIAWAGRHYHRHIRDVFGAWRFLNEWLFEGRLREPWVTIGTSGKDDRRFMAQTGLHWAYADTTHIGFHGGLFIGRHPQVGFLPRSYSIPDLRRRYWTWSLLHEMIHQWEIEIVGDFAGLASHGEVFASKARELETRLGLDVWKDLPSWPGACWNDVAMLSIPPAT